jgi:hypothetical protein
VWTWRFAHVNATFNAHTEKGGHRRGLGRWPDAGADAEAATSAGAGADERGKSRTAQDGTKQ